MKFGYFTLSELFHPHRRKYQTMKPEDFNDTAVLIGSSRQIADTLHEKVEKAGFDEVILCFNLGLKPHHQVKDGMARFMAEVAPGSMRADSRKRHGRACPGHPRLVS